MTLPEDDPDHLDLSSPISAVKYIGKDTAERLNAEHGIATIADFRDYLNRMVTTFSVPQLQNAIALLTGNRRRHTCDKEYLVRPLNRMAFNALADLAVQLLEVTDDAGNPVAAEVGDDVAEALICKFNEGTRRNGAWDPDDPSAAPFCDGTAGSVGPAARAMRKCPCLITRGQCDGRELLRTADLSG